MFELDTLKDKLDGETLSALQSHLNDLTGSRDAAKRESIEGRKALKEQVSSLSAAQARVLEKLGIESLDDLDNLPDPKAAKGNDDAIKQFEVKLKRMEREREEAIKSKDTLIAQMTQARKQAAIAQAISTGGFLDTESAELLLSRSIEQDGDDFFYKTKDGRHIPLADGAKLIATEKPHLVKAPQGTGSGWRDSGGAPTKTMPRSAFNALKPAERAQAMAKGVALAD